METNYAEENRKLNGNSGHYQMYNSCKNDVQEDVSLLSQPLRTALTGFREAKRAYENGTEEVRRLLMQECSLIYECMLCRNMFRSLANFISHKRVYCKQSIVEGNYRSFTDYSSSVIIQSPNESGDAIKHSKSRSTGCSPIPTKSGSRDLCKIIERLKRGDDNTKTSSQPIKPAPTFPAAPATPHIKCNDSVMPILQLERVPTSTQAVYQTLKNENALDSIKTEVDEVHNLLTNKNSLLGPDGKVVANHFLPSATLSTSASTTHHSLDHASSILNVNLNESSSTSTLIGQFKCEICNEPFQTEKTLNIHIQKKHNSSTYVFQCPTCSLTFLQPAAVIRHLANEHKKPLRRIRKMRESILKKRIQIGDVQQVAVKKGPSRELKRLQLDNDSKLANNLKCNKEGIAGTKPMSNCLFCEKGFERRAALVTHLLSCEAKKLNELPIKPKATKADKQFKLENQNKQNKQETTRTNKEPPATKTEVKQDIQEQAFISSSSSTFIKQEPQEQLSSTNASALPTNSSATSSSTSSSSSSSSSSPSSSSSATINEMFKQLENLSFGSGLQTLSIDKFENSETADDEKDEETEQHQEDNTAKDEKSLPSALDTSEETENIKKLKRFRILPGAPKQLTCRCKICNKQFNALSNLRRHISMFHYRSRRFGCTLCDYRAFRRYDIVNHLTFVHKMDGEREKMSVEYVSVHETEYSKDDVDGDIVVEAGEANEDSQNMELPDPKQTTSAETMLEKRAKLKKNLLLTAKLKKTAGDESPKLVHKRFKRSLTESTNNENKKRPIRNRIKPVNKDFVYDLSALKEEEDELNKEGAVRLTLKRRTTLGGVMETKNIAAGCQDNFTHNTTPPAAGVKITPYRLRTEPLISMSKKSAIKGILTRIYNKVMMEGLASPSTLPELPTERPQMRPRVISTCRQEHSQSVPVIDTLGLEAARSKSTLFDDSFLEKLAQKTNPSFKMRPMPSLQHSPLNSILQKFDATMQQNKSSLPAEHVENGIHQHPLAASPPSPTSPTIPAALVLTPSVPPTAPIFLQYPSTALELYATTVASHISDTTIMNEINTPNGKVLISTDDTNDSPPSAPKKRITLMQRLAENRAKRSDSIRNTFED